MNKFGDLIKTKREEQEMLQRHLAAQLDIDTAQLSKMESGERRALSLWLADHAFFQEGVPPFGEKNLWFL